MEKGLDFVEIKVNIHQLSYAFLLSLGFIFYLTLREVDTT